MVNIWLITITNRLRGVSDTGEEIIDLAPKIQKEFKQIAGIDIEAPNGGLRDTYSILKDMAEVFPTLTEQEQQFLQELASGSRQSKVLQAITSNWDEVEKAVASATNATGSALAENEKYLDSIDGKTQKMTSSFQALASSLIDSGFVKFFIDAGNGILQFLNIGDGLVGKLIIWPATILGVVAAFKALGNVTALKGLKDIGKPQIQGFIFRNVAARIMRQSVRSVCTNACTYVSINNIRCGKWSAAQCSRLQSGVC